MAGDDGGVFARAYQRLEAWRGRADYLDPYAFYARVLGPDHGRKDFYRRLGAEAEDVLDEFLAQALAFEETHTPSLEGFLDWLEAAETEIKRDAELLRDEVRVMTVHGAKGLEADVVFLVDNGTIPVHPTHDPRVLAVADETEAVAQPPLVWMRSRKLMPRVVRGRVEAMCRKAEEEYRRLLYVGMTRAKDRLYVCGIMKPRATDKVKGWHALVTRALEEESRAVAAEDGSARSARMARGRAAGAAAEGDPGSDDAGAAAARLGRPAGRRAGACAADHALCRARRRGRRAASPAAVRCRQHGRA